MCESLLAIYLNDHFAGAVAGAELAGRLAAQNRSDADFASPLTELAREIGEDRDTLRALMADLGVDVDHVKRIGAWAAEKLGRLKLNGRLLSYSPLSRVEELEALRIGATAKRMMWVALHELSFAATPAAVPTHGAVDRLRRLAARDELPAGGLTRLIERAEGQLERIEECHARACAAAFGATASGG
jgi:hypothetical protein